MNYDDVYYARATRWGKNYQERVKNQREELFRRYLLQSVYQVSFYDSEGNPIIGSLQPYKQDDTKTVECLLLEFDKRYPGGTIFDINDQKWMILRLDDDMTRGYLKYYMLRMTHTIEWLDLEGNWYSSPGYFYGPMLIHIKDLLESRGKEPTYLESNKTNHLIMPYNEHISKESYFRTNNESYVITGFDQDSTSGVCYISANSTYERDLTPAPELPPDYDPPLDVNDGDDDYFWLSSSKK